MSKMYISHNNNTERLSTNGEKNCPINNSDIFFFHLKLIY